ncbi:MAG: hypothetical protein KC900_05990 [Candidatus Omnitrophica bacterium]|nr:hypothetical protein [Candidatus Omnitrophota bacterium]
MSSICQQRVSPWRRAVSGLTAILFVFTGSLPAGAVQGLPRPGQMVQPSATYQSPGLRGVRIHPENPLEFDFIINSGEADLNTDALKDEAGKLIKYFLAALTIPEDHLWVNLSPYEEGRVISSGLGATAMGRDLLEQDYLLKQLSASLMYPEEELGRTFWQRVHERTLRTYGTTAVPGQTFHKVWIVPDKAVVYERDGGAYVVERHLKVMLEADYQASEYANPDAGAVSSGESQNGDIAAKMVREIIVPEIEREVNHGRHFATLRQIYDAMILATWYKRKLRDGLLNRIYVDREKVRGVDINHPKQVTEEIYQQYLEAFRKGVYDFVREDVDPVSRETVPRRYFSGGLIYRGRTVEVTTDKALLTDEQQRQLRRDAGRDRLVTAMLLEVEAKAGDQAMNAKEPAPDTEAGRLAAVQRALYPDGRVQPVRLADKHGDVHNLVVLDPEGRNFGHASTWKVNGGSNIAAHSFDLAVPTGNRKVSFNIVAPEGRSADGRVFTAALNDIVGLPDISGEQLFARPDLLTRDDHSVSGNEFVIRLDNLGGLNSLVISDLRFGSGKSIKDEKRSGPADPTAAAYTKQFVDEGRDIRASRWSRNGEPRFRATAQPRTADGLHDTHNYLVEIDSHQTGFRPGSVTIALNEGNDVVIHKDADVDYVMLRVRLYSDHTDLGHMRLEELYDVSVLEHYVDLQQREEDWFGTATAEQRRRYQRLVKSLRRHMLERNAGERQRRRIALLRSRISTLADQIGQRDADKQAALNPLRQYEDIPFFEAERLRILLYNGQFLITRNAAILAGSPYYLTPFGGDVIIILRELLGYLRPDVVRAQFYQLLKLVRNGQLAHEVDIRFHSDDERHLDVRLESPRVDTELLLMMFAGTMLSHPEYDIDWQQTVTGDITAAEAITGVARYVLERAQRLASAQDRTGLLGPKDTGTAFEDPRLDWEDASNSKAYGRYSHLIQYLVPFALQAINKLSESHKTASDIHVDPVLIEDWVGTRDIFNTRVGRDYRIEALMEWYRWRIKRTADGRRFVLAMLADALEYYGSDFTFKQGSDDELLASIREFLEAHVPLGDFVYQSKVLDAGGDQIRVADTNPLIFATSTADGVRTDEIKHGLDLVFTHVALGGVGMTEGSVQTGIPTVKGADREVRHPVSIAGIIPSTDLYEIYHRNYHGMIIWLSMNYKRLNGLIRQINHRLSNGEGFSQDVQMMYAAVELLHNDMNQLAELVTEETLEPYMNGSQRFRWRPYGSNVEVDDADGIQSGSMQGFNMMAMPAIVNLRRLRERIEALPQSGFMSAVGMRAGNLRTRIQEKPYAVRALIREWTQQQRTPLADATPQTTTDDQALLNTAARTTNDKDVGGIDLSSGWLDLQIKRDPNGVPLPVIEQPLDTIRADFEGFYPVIINVTPVNIPLILGMSPDGPDPAEEHFVPRPGSPLARR